MPDPDVFAVHEAACRDGALSYVDPTTGFQVFTRLGLLERGQCCGAGCRHCPYHHASVPMESRPGRIQQPAWLNGRASDSEQGCGLFWSGGKDSYLAYRSLTRANDHDEIVLITTFDRSTGQIAHQDLPIETVVAQAKHLNAPLIGIPLHSNLDYLDHVVLGLELMPSVGSLAFGDLHLEHIRSWRERAFGEDARTEHLNLKFPIWQIAYDILLHDLAASGVACSVSAVTVADEGINVGDRFDRGFIARLAPHIDAFGENGEFHTEISF